MAVKPVIKGVYIVPMGFANAFLIEGDDGLTLIDAGFPDKEAAVFAAIRGLGLSFRTKRRPPTPFDINQLHLVVALSQQHSLRESAQSFGLHR